MTEHPGRRISLPVWPQSGAAALKAAAQHHPLETSVGAASVVLGLAIAITSYVLQSHFSAAFAAGEHLSGWQNFLRLGAPWQSLVPVAAAGLLAGWGSFRLGSAQPEPPWSLGGGEVESVARLRGALRAERHTVRVAFVVMTGLAGIVVMRFLVYSVLALSGDHLATSTWVGVAIELGFWLGAWAAFWNWNRRHRDRMESWGIFDA
ncbi:MAG: hypothetical protein ACREOA_08005 [Candidatus Dormibacteria bacterium]